MCTFNCNGIGDHLKRKDIFDYLRNRKCQIYLLQETHLLESQENFIRSCWGYDVILSGNSTNSNGVAILFSNNFDFKIHNCKKDKNGCYIALDLEIEGNRFSLVNIYGPSSGDDPTFFDNIEQLILEFNNNKIIIAGDWNCTINFEIDNKNYSSSMYRARIRNRILDLMTQFELVDIWRINNPNTSSYTWRKFKTTKQARLDYFLVTDNLITQINDSNIDIKYKSDHSLVMLSLKQNCFSHDKSYWKFNKSLLKNKESIQQIKDVISKTKTEYCALVYDYNNIDSIPEEELVLRVSDQLFFEVLLMNIRGKCISFSSHLKEQQTQKLANFEDKLKTLEENVNENNLEEIETTKNEIEEIRQKRMEGLNIRSRTTWIREGEHGSKYFCNLESRHYTSKAMPSIETDTGQTLYNQAEILSEVKSFYEQLYKEKPTLSTNLSETLPGDTPKLTETQKNNISGKLTLTEIGNALKHMKNDKSPGSDGYSAEFYKFFYRDIGAFLLRSINEGFEKGELSNSQKQGVIICIPKENKQKKLLKNWRPITLLNYSYKIASAVIANRLKTVLPSIINECQKGFLKGRYIGENIRLIYDLLFYTNTNEIPGLILSIDYQKAFDSISWSFIENALTFFNFGNDIVKWFKTLYSDAKSNVHINGQYSSWFEIKRGVRQGDPCSPYFYLIGAEIFSIMLRTNPEIRGIDIRDKEYLLSQFADDTVLCLDGEENSFKAAINTLENFSSISGLKINNEKTQIMWIGSRKNSNMKYMRDRNYTWDPGIIKILGINFSTDLDSIFEINYKGKLTQIETLLRTWQKRNLTPFGKITIIKTLAIPKLLYLFLNLPDPPQSFIKQLEDIIYKFLWNAKPSKMNKQTIELKKEEGGLNMININIFLAGLKISWLKRLKINADFSTRVLNFYPVMKNTLKMGGEVTKVILQKKFNPFWEDVIKYYESICNACIPQNASEFVSDFIFFNKNILRDNKIVYIKEWLDKGIWKIGDLIKEDKQYMTYQEFNTQYNLNTNFIVYIGIIQAIKSYQIKYAIDINAENITITEPKVWNIILKGNDEIKERFRTKGQKHNAIVKWNLKFDNLNWVEIFKEIHKNTQDTKMKWFFYKIIYRIIPTNRHLTLLKIKADPTCNFCNINEQTISHLFWSCEHVTQLWNDLVNLIKVNCRGQQNLQFSEEFIIFGVNANIEKDTILYLIILYAKYFIFICKINNVIPRIAQFKNFLRFNMMIHRKSQPIHKQLHFDNMLTGYNNLLQ